MAVEGDVGVGEVVHEHELALAGEVDELLHQLGRRDLRRRVVRERDDHRRAARAGRRGRPPRSPSSGVGCRRAGRGRRSRRRAAARPGGSGSSGSARPRCRRCSSSTHIRWASPSLAPIVLTTCTSGSSVDAEVARVALADGLAQVRQAAARRVAVVDGLGGGLGELLDRDRRRGDVGVAEAEVDHVAAVAPQLAFELVDRREDVRGEIVDSSELHRATSLGGSTMPVERAPLPRLRERVSRARERYLRALLRAARTRLRLGRARAASSAASGSRRARTRSGATPTCSRRRRRRAPRAGPASRRSCRRRGSRARSASARCC